MQTDKKQVLDRIRTLTQDILDFVSKPVINNIVNPDEALLALAVASSAWVKSNPNKEQHAGYVEDFIRNFRDAFTLVEPEFLP